MARSDLRSDFMAAFDRYDAVMAPFLARMGQDTMHESTLVAYARVSRAALMAALGPEPEPPTGESLDVAGEQARANRDAPVAEEPAPEPVLEEPAPPAPEIASPVVASDTLQADVDPTLV